MHFDANPFTCNAKKKTGFEISLFYWSFSSDIMAVKWLKGNQSQDASWPKKKKGGGREGNKCPNIFISMLHLLVVFMQKIGWLVGCFCFQFELIGYRFCLCSERCVPNDCTTRDQ